MKLSSARAGLLALALCGASGCNKLNAAFGDGAGSDTEGDDGATTSGRPQGATSGATSGASDSDGTSPTTPQPVTTMETAGDATSEGSAGSASNSGSDTTALGSETGDSPTECEVGETPCDAFNSSEDCEMGWVCRPQGASAAGYDVTVCVEPLGRESGAGFGDACEIACHRYSGVDNCIAGSLCDPFQDAEARQCTEICQEGPGGELCPAETSCVEAVAAGADFGLCRQHCNPFDASLCPDMVCAALGIDVGPAFVCVPPVDGGAEKGDLCEGPGDCGQGLQCSACESGNCCATLCQPFSDTPNAVCADGLLCVPYSAAGGHPSVPGSIGVCV